MYFDFALLPNSVLNLIDFFAGFHSYAPVSSAIITGYYLPLAQVLALCVWYKRLHAFKRLARRFYSVPPKPRSDYFW